MFIKLSSSWNSKMSMGFVIATGKRGKDSIFFLGVGKVLQAFLFESYFFYRRNNERFF
jgi:hypothetical protein